MSSKWFKVLSVIIMATMLFTAWRQPPAMEPPPPRNPWHQWKKGEIKIGFISAFTGVFSSFGTMQKEGAELALEEYAYEVAGKKITVIYEDDQLDNEQAVTKAKKLVEQDKVDILTGNGIRR